MNIKKSILVGTALLATLGVATASTFAATGTGTTGNSRLKTVKTFVQKKVRADQTGTGAVGSGLVDGKRGVGGGGLEMQ